MERYKFRGQNEMGGWEVSGDTLFMDDFWKMVGQKLIKNVCQFTGLYDKNNKPIYEGDVITKDGKVKAEVFFYNACFVAKLEVPSNKIAGFGFVPTTETMWAKLDKDCEIIGDIYSTPELLTK